jgi:hypothetical protein
MDGKLFLVSVFTLSINYAMTVHYLRMQKAIFMLSLFIPDFLSSCQENYGGIEIFLVGSFQSGVKSAPSRT